MTQENEPSTRTPEEAPRPPLAYTAAQAAAIIGGSCKASWLKSQARSRKIPYLKIGGAYNFTEAHIAEIISILEVRPKARPPGQAAPAAPRSAVTAAGRGVEEVPLLADRTLRPRRGRLARDHPEDGPGRS